MKRLTLLTLPLLAVSTLVGCGRSSSSGPTYKKGDRIYQERILFDTSDEKAGNASIYLGIDKKVKTVKLGREEVKCGYKNKILTFSAKDLRNAGAGERTATVTFNDDRKASVDIFNATKFIRTAEEFQAIGASKTACEGYYVLANDIDCSSISNFEPIGQYFDEKDPTNYYFHGILDGDGYAIKNVTCSYSDSPIGPSGGNLQSNYDVYTGSPKFSNPAHQSGDNTGIFQVIGSSGVVRNVAFDNCRVHGRTIVGVVAANIMGRAENILVNSNCVAKMDTHFYDDDCNVGAAFGIVAGSGNVKNIICLTSQVSVLGLYEDYGPDYAGKDGNGWDHPAGSPANEANWWRFAGVSKEVPDSNPRVKITDSNGKRSNGVYAGAGKVWGQVQNSVGVLFAVKPQDKDSYQSSFSHTHQAINKPTSGDSDLGLIENCGVHSVSDLKVASTFTQYNFSSDAWVFQDGSFPTLVENINRFEIVK